MLLLQHLSSLERAVLQINKNPNETKLPRKIAYMALNPGKISVM